MKFHPRPYQGQIIDHIIEHPSAFVLAQMGSGKTAATLQSLKYAKCKKILIVAPLRVAKHTWPEEIKKWENFSHYKYSLAVGDVKAREKALAENASITIINIDNFVWLVKNHFNKCDFDMVILDESSCIKSTTSQRFKAFKRMRDKKAVKRWVLLTATPTPNNLLEAWPQMYVLDQGESLGKTFTAFKNRYFESDYMGYTWTPRPGTEDIIKDNIKKFAIVVENYEGLPDKIDINHNVELNQKMQVTYKQMEKDYIIQAQDNEITAVNAAVLVGKLAQLANGAIYDDKGLWINYHDEKIKELQSIMEQCPDENVLVAYQYKHDLQKIMQVFPHAINIKADYAIRDWNAGKIKMLIAHPQSAAHGLNLQKGGRRIIWYGPTWSNELKLQFDARLHRQGQERPVFVHTILSKNTIDQDIFDAVKHKKSVQDLVLQAIKK